MLIFKNDGFTTIIADKNLQIRFVASPTKEGGVKYYQLKGNILEHFITIEIEDTLNTYIAGFNKSNHDIYLLDSRNYNTSI